MQTSHLINSIGKLNGHFKDKHNRVRKLVEIWPYLETKMIHMIERGNGISLTARCAYAILLMMHTGIRVGNESSAEGYTCNNKYLPEFGKKIQTYGLTTLLPEHIHLQKSRLRIQFVGKKGVQQDLIITHPVLVKYCNMSQYPHVPGVNTWLGIDYMTLYKFVKKYIGPNFLPKDLRTAIINIMYTQQLSYSYYSFSTITRKGDINRSIKSVITTIAEKIGHTPSVCKSAYLSPGLISLTKEMMTEIVAKNKEKKK